MNNTYNDPIRQSLILWDKLAMMRPDINVVGHYDPKDSEYEPPIHFERKRDEAWRLIKKIVVGLSIVAMIALVVANEVLNARMTEAFYG